MAETHTSAPELAPEDRELLERYAPCLAYDPQDGLRATSAATMTDNDENALRRADRREIAAGAGLRLATLTDYPGTQQWEEGDYLASAGGAEDALIDAIRMQALDAYPHVAYGRVLRVAGTVWLQYWLWYYDNPKTFAGRGRHQGDWELVQIGLGGEGGGSLTCSQHSNGETKPLDQVERVDGDHPLIYVSPFSHANYLKPGTFFYFPTSDHPTAVGPRVVPRIEPFGAWQDWRGRWGAERGALGGRLRALGGVAPAAPILQRKRWNHPDQYCEAARRPVNNKLRDVLWLVGKGTYPKPPTLRAATQSDGTVEVRYELAQSFRRRSSHILITITGDDPIRPLAGKQLLRSAPDEGTVTVNIRSRADGYLAWASTFNRIGQRSDIAGPIAVA